MANEPNIARILVQLDALLDTRLGTLSRINPEGIEALVTSGYQNRKVDFFEGYDTQQFNEMYAKRDKETLMLSIETKMFLFLGQLVDVLDEQTIMRPYHSGVEIVVNTHPYVLDEEDLVTIRNTVDYWTKGMAPVKLVTIPPKDLTPEFCKANYSAMIFYDFAEWLPLHIATLDTVRMVDVTIYIPSIFKMADKDSHQTDLEHHIKTSAHPFEALEWLTKMYFYLEIVDADMFSFADINALALASHVPSAPGDVGAGVE